MTRRPSTAGRLHRCVLGVLLFVSATVWTGGRATIAAAPAELVSVNVSGVGPLTTQDGYPSVSGDGSVVVFTAFPPIGTEFGSDQVFVRNRTTGSTTAVPLGFLVTATTGGVVSRDGCHVAYWGYFAGINFGLFVIPPNWDVYTWDRCTAGAAPVLITTASDFPALTSGGSERGPLAISSDGRYVAYIAQEFGLSPRIARIDTNGAIESRLASGLSDASSIDISDNGAFIGLGVRAVIADINRDVVIGWTPPCTGAAVVVCNTEMISVTGAGQPAAGASSDPSLSADGRYVAFTSTSLDLIGQSGVVPQQVFIRDRATGTNRMLTNTPGQAMVGSADAPEISPDGTQIAFTQSATPPNNSVAFPFQALVARSTSGLYDTAVFDLVSYGVSGAAISSSAFEPSMSSNGRYVAFSSSANSELSGTTMPNGSEVWMRQRPIALDITPTLDFGTVAIGAQSAARDAVVQNTSGVPINISSVVLPAGPFSITGNSCGG
ncbi:MAG: TolB family protein, partial [Ilumatobacteraceae bacterium]